MGGLVPQNRPAWWTPERVLDLLDGGERPMSLCRRVSYEVESVSHKQVYNDITIWRKQVDGFDERYRLIVRRSSVGAGGGGRRSDIPPGWELLWLKAWEATGRPLKACDLVEEQTGYRPSYPTIRAKTNPKHALYSAEFHERYKASEEIVIAARVDDLFEIVQDPNVAGRDRAYIDLQILERRASAEWGRNSRVQHDGTIVHEHGPSPGLMVRFNEAVSGRFDRLAAPDPVRRLNAEEEVVDAELIEETA